MEKTTLLCDSSSLISLTDACLDDILDFLSLKFGIQFVIPASVEQETVTRPVDSDLKQYLFSALKIKRAINHNIIVRTKGDNTRLTQETEEILRLANNMFFVKGKPLRLVHLGEAEMLALAKELDVSQILIDERTTRMLIEAPFKLKDHLEKEFSVHIMVSRENMLKFTETMKDLQVIRSSELALLAYEHGYFNSYDELKDDMLKASLYKLKFSGCSISFEEIKEYLDSMRGHNGAAVPGK